MNCSNMVDITSIDSRIVLDIRYATSNNFCNKKLYPIAACFLHHDCAEALTRVQTTLAKKKLFLKIFDGYRPVSVQQIMWDIVQDENYVMNPAKGLGRHARGTAVDLTLVDSLGNELEMPSAFDDFTERAHRNNAVHLPKARYNMQLLEEAMISEGFIGWPLEWWHYDLINWQDNELYPSLDIDLKQLQDRKKESDSVTQVISKIPGSCMSNDKQSV